jgi:hypothetical protein
MDEITRLFEDAQKIVDDGMVMMSEENLFRILPVFLNHGIL